jgi:hypothetical protein
MSTNGTSDDRRSPRRPMIKMAQVTGGNKFSIDCVVLDLSDAGVQLAYRSPANVPDFITIKLPGGKVVSGRVRWRTADTFGVEFV